MMDDAAFIERDALLTGSGVRAQALIRGMLAWPLFLVFASMGSAQMVALNEIVYLPTKGRPEYLVLSNQTRTIFDIARWRATEGITITLPDFDSSHPTDSFLKPFETLVLSAADPSRTRAAYGWAETRRVFGPWVGELSDQGESLRIEDKDGKVVCEAAYVGQGRAQGRLVVIDPQERLDRADNWRAEPDNGRRKEVAAPSRAGRLEGEVVINEIMYDPPAGHPMPEYIELVNRGALAIDLGHWRLTGAVRFEFPPGTVIAPGAFLVVSKDAVGMRALLRGTRDEPGMRSSATIANARRERGRMSAAASDQASNEADAPAPPLGFITDPTVPSACGGIQVIGDFKGHLSSKGEQVRLLDAEGRIADEVTYEGGGAWPELARGRGSSLELIHPDMDNLYPSAWAASVETAKSRFVSCIVTGVYSQLKAPGEPSDYKELMLYLADDGGAILRNIQLIHAGTNCLARADRRGDGSTGWLCQGTHGASRVSNGELRVISDGHGDNRANHIELDVPALEINEPYELRLEARWLFGSPRLIVQTFDQSLAGSFALPIPDQLGTPGRPNSCLAAAPLPQLDELVHEPPVPAPGQPVRIRARVSSVVSPRTVTLFYRSWGADWKQATAFDDGKRGGDNLAADGVYTAQWDGSQTNGQVVQFYLEAKDQNGAVGRSPLADRERPAMWVVDGRSAPEDLRVVRLVVWPGDLEALQLGTNAAGAETYPRLSNHYLNATVIEGERVVHGAQARPRGSPLTRTADLSRVNVKWPLDHLHFGQSKWIYDDDASKGIAYHNRVARYLLYLFGQPVSDAEFVYVAINGGAFELREETEPIGKEFLDRRFENGRKGDLYKIDDQWWIVDSGEGEMQDASWEYRGPQAERYRNAWMKRTHENADDYSRLLEFFKVVSNTNSTQDQVEQHLDAEACLRVAVVRGFIGDWDNFTMQRGRNGYFYRPPGEGRFLLLHWDSDEGFMTGPPLSGPFIDPWLKRPENWRRFEKHVNDLIALAVTHPDRVRAWLKLEHEAVGQRVFQANYLNFFEGRSQEARLSPQP